MFYLVRGSAYLLFLVHRSCDHFSIHCAYLLYMLMNVSFTYLYMCFFFSLFMHMLLIICMQSIISISHKDTLMSFVLSVSEIQDVKVYLP